MSILAKIAALASGFVLMGYHGSAADLLATSIAINLSLGPVTAVVAHRRGRSPLRWAAAGVCLGLWALAAALLLPVRPDANPPTAQFPPPSHAA